jgi:toxin ParE1/3/4
VRVILSPAARRDLEDILRYTEQKWGRGQRNRYREHLKNGLAHLSRYPEVGRLIDSDSRSPRQYVIGSHVVIYFF